MLIGCWVGNSLNSQLGIQPKVKRKNLFAWETAAIPRPRNAAQVACSKDLKMDSIKFKLEVKQNDESDGDVKGKFAIVATLNDRKIFEW